MSFKNLFYDIKTKLKTLTTTVIMGINKRLCCFILSFAGSLTNICSAGTFKSVVRQIIGFNLSASSEKASYIDFISAFLSSETRAVIFGQTLALLISRSKRFLKYFRYESIPAKRCFILLTSSSFCFYI